MKKLLTAILVVAMIATLAVVSFADGDNKLVITAGSVEVKEGATSVEVPITITNIKADLGISSVLVSVKVAAGKITDIAQADLTAGNWVVNVTEAGDEASVMWAEINKGCTTDGVVFGKAIVELPADAKAGDEIAVQIIVSDDDGNYVSFEEVDGDTLELGATGVDGKITVVADATPIDQPSDDSSDKGSEIVEPIDGSDDSGKASETESDTSKQPEKATQTGDVAIIVVVAMVVALGTAIVVKKVNVK